ncbi:hypothetical protein CFBP4996_18050 [Agrobacterium leguminum]|uniref:Uncharacterized protein n=2 Tax=Agrobacterium TaxID=357 RepID=A0A1S7TYB9_9HYPH|nr:MULTISPECIES: hypothetical protein [Agrobacterium]MCZ7909401.1 hypothetical protein [Agrobacterium leguminum]WFS67927.1 hypothetical protein CFBP4996_18050 [Agrobacterium leguminum]CVI59566.1 hypothetical protein AGR7A_Lc120594 [Agrobacterium deltaense NCPPB 1641]
MTVPLDRQKNIADVAPRVRQQLGLGSAATQGTDNFATAAQGVKADNAFPRDEYAIFDTVVDMPDIEVLPSIDFIRVNGYYAAGDGGGGSYVRTENEPMHAGKFQTADGSWWELALSSLNFQGKDVLPAVGVAYIIDQTYQIDAADENYILNGGFNVWHEGYMPTSLSENTNAMILAQWRAETVGTGTSINSIQKISGASGGLRFNAVFGVGNGLAYVRQNILGVRQFSGKQFTSVIDIEVDVACVMDFYVRMRINASDASVDRPLVVDTNELAISPGRKLVAVTFNCPDVSSYIGVENFQNSLEYAFRIQGSSKTVNVKVYGATVTSGRKLRAPTRATYIETLTGEDACFEVGVAQINGFTASSGQKRLFTQYRSKKIRTPAVTVYDMAGTAGRVSTYDSAGTRTDGVAPSSVISDDFGVGVVLITSTACGIAFRYAANAYP